MSHDTSLTINELERDRWARVAELELGNKTIVTPCFCTRIHTPWDLEIYMDLKSHYPTRHLGAYMVRIFDAHEILMPKLKRIPQKDFFGRPVEQRFITFMKENLLFVDPALEYLYYEDRPDKFMLSPRMPREIVGYSRRRKIEKGRMSTPEYNKWKRRFHALFWNEIYKDEKTRSRVVRGVLEYEMLCGADILIPPVPLTLSGRLLDLSMSINSLSQGIALAKRKECATYLMFPNAVLRNLSLIDRAKQYLEEEETRLTILKFKYLELAEKGKLTEKENYRDLMRDLAFLANNSNKAFMVIENGYQVYLSACVGFDVVSTSITGYDGEGGFSTHPSFGSWYFPEKMIHVPYDEAVRIFKNNNNHLPCGCPECRGISDISLLSPDEWNSSRRRHYVLSMDANMTQLEDAIKGRRIELAREKVMRSDLVLLRDLLP